MDIHKNARTTPRSRAAIVKRVTELGESIKGVARAVGVCPKTVRKWLRRAESGAGLMDRSCRPRRMPTATLTGTSDAEHMKQDLASHDLPLSADEVRAIESLAG